MLVPLRAHSTAELVSAPLSLLISLLLVKLAPIFWPVYFLSSIVFHELGHTLVLWLQGRPAIPSLGVTLPLSNNFQPLFALAMIAIVLWAFSHSQRAKSILGSFFCLLFISAFVCFTLFIPTRIADQLVIFAGLGGEIILATLCLISFYAQFSPRLNWGQNRYLFLICGSLCYVRAADLWISVKRGKSQLPYGSFMDLSALTGDTAGASGDINRLIANYGWSESAITSVYFWLLILSLLVLMVFYLQLILQFQNQSSQAD